MSTTPPDQTGLTFSEVVLTGGAAEVRQFLARLCAAAGKSLTCWFHAEAAIDDREGALHKTAEKLHLVAGDVHLVASDDIVGLLRADAAAAEALGLRIQAVTPVRGASFALTYRAYTEAHDQEIQNLLHDLPRSLQISDEIHDVKRDPGARGVEAYSPAHDYEAHGAATISGRVDLVIAKRTQLAEHELIDPHRIVLERAAG